MIFFGLLSFEFRFAFKCWHKSTVEIHFYQDCDGNRSRLGAAVPSLSPYPPDTTHIHNQCVNTRLYLFHYRFSLIIFGFGVGCSLRSLLMNKFFIDKRIHFEYFNLCGEMKRFICKFPRYKVPLLPFLLVDRRPWAMPMPTYCNTLLHSRRSSHLKQNRRKRADSRTFRSAPNYCSAKYSWFFRFAFVRILLFRFCRRNMQRMNEDVPCLLFVNEKQKDGPTCLVCAKHVSFDCRWVDHGP